VANISLDPTDQHTRVLVLDAAAASSDLRDLGTISHLAAAAARQWAPCLDKRTGRAEGAARREPCSAEQHDRAV
jgi:hypothetical protein